MKKLWESAFAHVFFLFLFFFFSVVVTVALSLFIDNPFSHTHTRLLPTVEFIIGFKNNNEYERSCVLPFLT